MRVRNIKELAELAGVSSGTVSRALADSSLINPGTRARIQALAREHQFQPNALARNLRTRRTGAIGVLIPLGHETGQHLSEPFFITMLGLIADALTERGYDMLLSRVIPTDPDWLARYVDSGRVDGIVVIGQSDQAAALDAVAGRFAQLVVWGAEIAGQRHCTVGSDNRAGGAMAARHLIARGCQRLAFFGDPKALEIDERLAGAREALAEAGRAQDDLTVLPTHLVAEVAQQQIAAFLARGDATIDGVMAASDVIGLSALRALADRGLAVPDAVRVIGFDGLALGEHTMPSLSTIAQDLKTGAGHLVTTLLRRMAGEDAPSVVMPPRLVVRQSS